MVNLPHTMRLIWCVEFLEAYSSLWSYYYRPGLRRFFEDVMPGIS